MHLTPYNLLAFLLVPVFALPPPQRRSTTFNAGDIVGVRPSELEGKSKATKDVSIHPGVVLSSNKVTKKFKVAMISNKLPNNPPQAPIQNFYHSPALQGNIKLSPPKEIENAKPWKSKQTGGRQSPMSSTGVQKLKDAMKPHEGWRTPPPSSPSSPSPPSTPEPPSPKKPQKPGQTVPEWRQRPPQVNAHASGSRIPVPAHAPAGGSPNNAVRKPNPITAAQKNPSGRPPKSPVAPSQPHRPANRSPPPTNRNPRPANRSPRPANRNPRPANKSPRPANRSPRPANRSPRPANRSPRPASRSSTRPGSPPNRPPWGSNKPKDQKGKQPVRGKREFMRKRAVRSDY